MGFQRISVTQSKQIIETDKATILDIRDSQSYEAAHIENARHVDNHTVIELIESVDKSLPLLIYCYHGNASQSAANYFVEQGFSTVYSMDGGFEEWRQKS